MITPIVVFLFRVPITTFNCLQLSLNVTQPENPMWLEFFRQVACFAKFTSPPSSRARSGGACIRMSLMQYAEPLGKSNIDSAYSQSLALG